MSVDYSLKENTCAEVLQALESDSERQRSGELSWIIVDLDISYIND